MHNLSRLAKRGTEGVADTYRGAARGVREDVGKKLHADRLGKDEIARAGKGLRSPEPGTRAPGSHTVDQDRRMTGAGENVSTVDPEFGITRLRDSPPFATKSMLEKYRGEDRKDSDPWKGRQVKYYNERRRQRFLLTVRDGKIYDARGKLYNTTGCGRMEDGHALFVMDKNGRIFSSKHEKIGEFQHSSFMAGDPVASAGTIYVKDGVFQGMRDQSGHYEPTRSHTLQVIDRLRSLGVEMDVDQVYFIQGK